MWKNTRVKRVFASGLSGKNIRHHVAKYKKISSKDGCFIRGETFYKLAGKR